MHDLLDLMETNLLLLDASEKFLSLIRFANDRYTLYNWPNAISQRFGKNMKTCESVERNVELFSFVRLLSRKQRLNQNCSIGFLFKISVLQLFCVL